MYSLSRRGCLSSSCAWAIRMYSVPLMQVPLVVRRVMHGLKGEARPKGSATSGIVVTTTIDHLTSWPVPVGMVPLRLTR